jgi:spermidine synthase
MEDIVLDHWYTEQLEHHWRTAVRVTAELANVQSEYQHIEIFETDTHGRMLVIDGKIQACELDEFVYHEMLAHVPLLTHPDPKRVLVVGGGDGGTMREVLRHPSVQEGTLAEIDQQVIDLCKRFMPTLAAGLAPSERLKFMTGDASVYIREVRDLDVILVDSSDPVGPSEALFTETFYRELKVAMAADGIVSFQAGTPFFYGDQVRKMYHDLKRVFTHVRPYLVPIPTYPSGTWCLMTASDALDPLAVSVEQLAERVGQRSITGTRYYTPQTHHGSLAIPPFLGI